jgi:protein TonB
MIPTLELLEVAGTRLRRWTVAGAVMFSMHATAGAIALVDWAPDDNTVQDTAGAFMLELAPVAMAPPTEKLNLAIGQRSEEVAASVATAPMQEVKEKSDVETPNIAESPLAPKPEVVVEKKKEVVEKPKEEVKPTEDPRPQQEAVVQKATAPQEAKAPPPVEAPPAEKPVGPKQGVSSKPSEAQITWEKAVALHLNKHKRYPGEAAEKKEEGIPIVRFSVDRSGKVIATSLQKSCGFALLDKEAIEMLNRASPFPKMPSDLQGVAYNFNMPIRFEKKK